MRFDKFHPAISLLYFAAAVFFILIFSHPVCAAISFACAAFCLFEQRGRRAAKITISAAAGAILFSAIYTCFNHFGVTNIGKTFAGNNITFESLAYGVNLGVRLAAAFIMFILLTDTMTTDKVIYLLSKISGRLALFISQILRSIPQIKEQFSSGAQCRKNLCSCTGASVMKRMYLWLKQISSCVMWSAENLINRSDAMACRAYGVGKRSSYSIYRFDSRDRSLVIMLSTLIFVLIAALSLEQMTLTVSAELLFAQITATNTVFYLLYAAFLLIPPICGMLFALKFSSRFQKK